MCLNLTAPFDTLRELHPLAELVEAHNLLPLLRHAQGANRFIEPVEMSLNLTAPFDKAQGANKAAPFDKAQGAKAR
jgi:hypothetical protein